MNDIQVMRAKVRQILGENLRALMTHHQQANRRMAEKLGIGEGTIQRAKTGQVSLTVDNVETIAAFFNLEAWQLFTPDLDPRHPPQLTFPSPEERDLYERFKKFVGTREG